MHSRLTFFFLYSSRKIHLQGGEINFFDCKSFANVQLLVISIMYIIKFKQKTNYNERYNTRS